MSITSVAGLLLSAVTICAAAVGAGEPPAVVRRLMPSENGYALVEIKTGAAFWKKVEEISGLGAISVKEPTLTVFRKRADDGGPESADRRRADGGVIFTAARGMHGIVYMAVAVGRKPSGKGEKGGDFAILNVEILKHNEAAGAKIAQESFLGRFRGRRLDGFPGINPKADAVSGATISSRTVVEGIKKALAIAEARFESIE